MVVNIKEQLSMGLSMDMVNLHFKMAYTTKDTFNKIKWMEKAFYTIQ